MKVHSHILQELENILWGILLKIILQLWKFLKIVKIDLFLIQLKNFLIYPFGGGGRRSAGKIYNETRGISKFRITQNDEIINNLISYFDNNPLQGRKALQFTVLIKIVKILATERKRTL